MTIPGPQGTGDKFKKKVAELMARGFSELKSRRIASGINNQKRRRK
ncbi:MAG TPA: hypothetical protein VLH94_04120 [Spirochaetia bacterium]|nr:hypothetical protein [Spirochaetia bacterium]